MNEDASLLRLMARHGTDVQLLSDNVSYTFKAVVNPFRNKNRFYLESENSPLGKLDKGHLHFVAAAASDAARIRDGDFVIIDGAQYWVKRSEKHYLRNKPLYIWAILTRQFD